MRLIDADTLRASVLEWENCYNGFSDTYDKARIIDAIDEQPTISPVLRDKENGITYTPVRRGRWLTEYGDHIHAGLRSVFICCSECGMVTAVEWHYCPNCGAKMEEEDGTDLPKSSSGRDCQTYGIRG